MNDERFKQFLKALREAFLMIVDAIETFLEVRPKTSEIRRLHNKR